MPYIASQFGVNQNGLVLAQSRSKGKKNEHKTVQELIDLIELQGAIVTMDAMNTQRAIVEKLHRKKADYVLPVKDNQKKLHEEIRDYFSYIIGLWINSVPTRLFHSLVTK